MNTTRQELAKRVGWKPTLANRSLIRSLSCIGLFLIWSSTLPLALCQSPIRLYKDLAASVQVAQGTMILNVSEGFWKTRLPSGETVILRFAPGTKITSTFDYSSGILQNATLTINPAVHLWIKQNARAGFSASLDSIAYDGLGDPTPHLTSDHPGTDDPNLVSKLERGLRLDRSAAAMLEGRPWNSLAPAQPCTDAGAANCSPAKPYITEVRFEKLDDAHPGLHVELKDGSTIHFSVANGAGSVFDNVLTVTGSSMLTFSQIDYTTDNQRLLAQIDDFDVQVQNGVVNSKDVGLVLQSGSRLTFQNVSLTKQGTVSTVGATSGHLTCTVAAGSRVNLTTGVLNPSDLVFAAGSQLNLTGFSLGISDTHKTDIMIGGGSQLTVQLASARLGFGTDGFLSVGSGALNAIVDGDWDSSAIDGPRADLRITLVDATLDGGIFDLNADSHLKLTSGSLKATNLEFKGFQFSGFSGTVSHLSVALSEGDTFGVPGGLQITTGPGATLVAATPEDPLVFTPGAAFPTGLASMHLPFSRFVNSKIPSFALKDGVADIKLANRQDGTIVGSDGTVQGAAVMIAGNVQIGTTFNITNLSVFKSPGKTPVVRGDFTGSLGSIDMTYTSSPIYHTPGHDNLRIYPLTAEMKVAGSTAIPPSKIVFDDSGLALTSAGGGSINIPLRGQLIVPPGRGEHQQPDDDDSTADGTHGPDQDQHRQEIVTDTFVCRIHLYAIADTYNITAQLNLSAHNGVVTLAATNFVTDRAVGFDRDGCDGAIASVIGAIAGTLFAGPLGGALGAAVGFVAGGDLNNMIDSRIKAVIAEKIQGLQVSWHFQT